MEELIMEEKEENIKEIKKKENVKVNGLFNIEKMNVIWRMIDGERY
jgi:hypothetical protein